MKRTEAHYSALNAIAIQCRDEMKGIPKSDLPALKVVSDKHAAKAGLIGFSKTEMMIQIGRVNGVLTDRRLG